MKVLFIIFSLFITACGSSVSSSSSQSLSNNWEQNPDFAEHIHDFIFDAHRYGVDLSINNLHIRFTEIEKPVVGRCWNYPDTVLIEIDPIFWQSTGVINQQILMYHELGHCILKRTHEVDKVSIMAPRLVPAGVYLFYREAYIEELFDMNTFDSLRLQSFLDNPKE